MMSIKNIFKNKLVKLRKVVITICSQSNILSSLYYFIFSTAFHREHQAVLKGKIKYLNDVESDSSSFYQLIRNTHRIEKGLTMRPRRSVFALAYIEETIDCFKKNWKGEESLKDAQLKWSKDVLDLYFSVTDGNKIIANQKNRFKKIIHGITNNDSGKSLPYHNKIVSNISYDEFYKLTQQRRSTRWFIDKKVSRKLIDKAILAAIQSPSACNRQPFEYRIIDDKELLKEIVEFPGGTAGYAHNIPLMIVTIGNLDAYFSERDRHLIYIDASLANMSLIFALETLGLSSCAINWPDVEKRERKMEEFLNLEKYQRPVMCLAVGYADAEGMVAYSEKKKLDRIRKYN